MCLHPPKIDEYDAAVVALTLLSADPVNTVALSHATDLLNDQDLMGEDVDQEQPRPHGNKGADIPDRKGNKHRDRTAGERRLDAFSERDFRRRFKVSRDRFWKLVDLIRPHVEPDELGKHMAEVSSGSFVPPATLRYVTEIVIIFLDHFI